MPGKVDPNVKIFKSQARLSKRAWKIGVDWGGMNTKIRDHHMDIFIILWPRQHSSWKERKKKENVVLFDYSKTTRRARETFWIDLVISLGRSVTWNLLLSTFPVLITLSLAITCRLLIPHNKGNQLRQMKIRRNYYVIERFDT